MTKLSFEDKLRLQIMQEELANKSKTSNSQQQLADEFVMHATHNIEWQRDIIYDNNLYIALFGERRSSKSNLMAIIGVQHALAHSHCQVLYIGQTQDACSRVMYDQVLPRLMRSFPMPAKLVGGDQMKFDNGSIIYLIGLDANKKQKERVRGTKASLIMVDEMQSYTQDVGIIISDVLGPAMADTKASIIASGTAGNAHGKNYWYEITKHNTKLAPIGPSVMHPEWQVYRLGWEHNTAIDEQTGQRICDNVRDYLANLRAKHPGIESLPSYRQEWNAEWIKDESSLMYRYSSFNLITSPDCIDLVTHTRINQPSRDFLDSATYILGADFGYNDPSALCVCCYNLRYSNKLYVIATFQKSEMLIPQVIDKIHELDKLYHFSYMVGDSSDLQQFKTIQSTYSLPIVAAERSGKLSHKNMLNGDMLLRDVIFLPGNEELIGQLQTLSWNAKALAEGKYVEDPGGDDLADSFLYAHHFSRHMWYEAPKPVLTETEAFLAGILNGEKQLDRSERLSRSKERFNPYQRKNNWQ